VLPVSRTPSLSHHARVPTTLPLLERRHTQQKDARPWRSLALYMARPTGLHPESVQEVIALNIAQEHRRAGLRRIFLELQEHRRSLAAGDLEELIDRLQQHQREAGHCMGADLLLHACGDGGNKLFDGRRRGQDDVPMPENVFSAGEQVTWEHIIVARWVSHRVKRPRASSSNGCHPK